MKHSLFIFQLSIACAVIFLLDHLVVMLLLACQIDSNTSAVLLGCISITSLIIGFFKLLKEHSYMFVMLGIIKGIQALYFYQANLADSLKFLFALLVLFVISYAWYKMSQKSNKKDNV